ncbi:Alcohol dehydrogenase superfamily, zinc-type [Trema orientale]|uniref:Alcohol dehydrogenase superfamily, zinc-type n=1 Tax=Trema orientale TaxID=63057 RepID=A0A2P5FH03_TREOI|nr:Alcohol dehydrogenase superfamily, zinc-type [Trema orientale]
MATSYEEEHPQKAFGWAARDASGIFSPFHFSRRETGEKDVTFKVLYCGICHSDLHMVKSEWGSSTYPLVPGYYWTNWVHFKLLPCKRLDIDQGMSDTYKDSPDSFHFLVVAFQNRLITIKQ